MEWWYRNNLRNIKSRIYEIENEFKQLINYKKLENLLDSIQIQYDVENDETFIENPAPNLDFEVFNNLYFFSRSCSFSSFLF